MKEGIKEAYMYILATIVVLCIMIFTYALIFYEVPKENIQIINILAGALIGAFLTVVGYFFGSSKSSSDKTKLLVNNNTEK
jgi:heme O synthase-like polyprenyltransferase